MRNKKKIVFLVNKLQILYFCLIDILKSITEPVFNSKLLNNSLH